MIKLEEGVVLCTKNSQALTNAIVMKVEEDEITVLTDFGNVRKIDPDVLLDHYEISGVWLYHQRYKEFCSPYPSVKERVEQQIEKLKDVLVELTELEEKRND